MLKLPSTPAGILAFTVSSLKSALAVLLGFDQRGKSNVDEF